MGWKGRGSGRLCRREVLAESFCIVGGMFFQHLAEKAVEATGFGYDFFGRKNKPICGRVICCRGRFAQHFVHVVEGDGCVKGGLTGGGGSGFEIFEVFVALVGTRGGSTNRLPLQNREKIRRVT